MKWRVSFFCNFVFGSYEPVSDYLLKVTEAEQEKGNQLPAAAIAIYIG